MAELMVDFIISLDRFGAAEGWPGLWGLGGPDYLARLDEESRIEYTVLMGATTFDGRLQLLEFTPTVLQGPPATPTP